jgi:hypothetical protein
MLARREGAGDGECDLVLTNRCSLEVNFPGRHPLQAEFSTSGMSEADGSMLWLPIPRKIFREVL